MGHDNNFIGMLKISNLKDVIEGTMQDINKEQKLCLESFSKTRNKVL